MPEMWVPRTNLLVTYNRDVLRVEKGVLQVKAYDVVDKKGSKEQNAP